MNGENKHYVCRNCKESVPLEETKAGSATGIGNCICKKCHSIITYNSIVLKSLDLYPERYRACNGCDRYFVKYASHGSMYKPPIIRTACPFCGSKDIEGA